jgi:hypothetical protein
VVSAILATLASGWALRRQYEQVLPPCKPLQTSPDMAMSGDFWTHFITGGKVPKEPFPDQRRSPCKGSTVSINGGCWIRTADRPPCPDDQYADGQGCYFPIGIEKPRNSNQ